MKSYPPYCTNGQADLSHCTMKDCMDCHWNKKNAEADQTDLAIGTVKLLPDENGIYRYRRVNKKAGVV